MKLSELKKLLNGLETVNFRLPDGSIVPEHFHVTEAGLVSRDFIDCGGTIRSEKSISLQLWSANDTDHRLKPEKFVKILDIAERAFPIQNFDVEVEFQSDTIGRYDLAFDGSSFLLVAKKTACLAQDQCGIPADKQKVSLSSLAASASACTPGGGCC